MKVTAVLTALTVGLAAVLAPAQVAAAATAPRVIAGVHADAVSTFLDDGTLALGSKADVEEGNGTRFAAADIAFQLENEAKATVPAGFEFIAPAGSDVWIAPESNPGTGRLWPGFSTESVPAGGVEGNQTTFTLTGVDGPGAFELFTTAGFGGAKRLWSSDDDGFTAFTVGRTHMHANWAFTAAGTYRIGVEAAATVAGKRQTAGTTYTFVVGDPPPAAEFGITGLKDSYAAGAPIDLGVTGATLADGQSWRWLIRLAGMTSDYSGGRAERFVRDATTALDGASIKVQLRSADNKTVQETGYQTLHITGPNAGTGEQITIGGVQDSYYRGDQVKATVTHRSLKDGEQGRWRYRGLPGTTAWNEPAEAPLPVTGTPGAYYLDTTWLYFAEWSYEIVDAGGTVVGRSAALSPEIGNRELLLSGIRTVYRAGDTLQAGSELYPPRDDVAYEWGMVLGGEYSKLPGATAATLELPVTAELDGATLYLDTYDATTRHHIVSTSKELRVTDAAPGERMLFIDPLSEHYHQGNTIKLNAAADPVAGATDTYRWFWQRGDRDAFTPMAGITGASHELRAEQALDGTKIKAELRTAAGELLATSEPATVHVDDHGAAPQQKVTLDGLADHYHTGDDIALTAAVAPASVLTRWEWHLNGAPIAGQNGPTLSLPATAAHDGATVLARLTFDDGRTYVESAPVTVHVEDHAAAKLSISGLAEGEYQPGASVTLQAVQSPQGPLTTYQWFSKLPGADGFTPIPGETGAAYTFTATRGLDGAAYQVKLLDGEHVEATSGPVTLEVAAPQEGSSAAKTITATISETEGALVLSVAAADRAVTLPAAALNGTGDRWESTGTLKPVTVTDTRSGRPGWTASGQVADGFRATGGETFTGSYLGWTPTVVQQAEQQGVAAGPVTAPDQAGTPGTGLGGSAVLATAPDGSGRGTARLDAALELSVPTDTATGTYTGVLTLTAI